MSLEMFRDIRGWIISSSSVKAISPSVSKSNIKVGWPKSVDSFPCILITQAGGSDFGYLGYRTAAAGSRMRRETSVMQIDIYSRDSRRHTLQLADAITPTLIASSQARKTSDVDTYDDGLSAYRKILSYTISKEHDD